MAARSSSTSDELLPLLVRRLAATIPVMVVVALVVFGLLRLTPGDPAAVIAGDYATPDDVATIRARLGLDQPLHVQLGRWFGNLLRGDLGTSIFSGLPVTTLIKQRVEPTVALATLTMLVAITIAVPLGVLVALPWAMALPCGSSSCPRSRGASSTWR